MINFGKYDQRIAFISFGDAPDGYGGNIPIKSVVLNTFANVVQMKGSNTIEQAQMSLPKTYLMKVLYRSDFVPSVDLQIAYRGFQYKILGVEMVQERLNWEWVITASGTGKEIGLITNDTENNYVVNDYVAKYFE
jgi:SPP1 family predicted phage head-tail adaptor